MKKNELELRRDDDAWTPFREISSMQRRFEQLLGELNLSENGFSPLTDIEETDGQYLISLDVPGLKKDDIRIELNNNQLIVSGERRDDHKEGEKGRRRFERRYGYFERSFLLPTQVSAEKVEANYHDGVLEVAIPKSEAAKARQITVKEGKKTTKVA